MLQTIPYRTSSWLFMRAYAWVRVARASNIFRTPESLPPTTSTSNSFHIAEIRTTESLFSADVTYPQVPA